MEIEQQLAAEKEEARIRREEERQLKAAAKAKLRAEQEVANASHLPYNRDFATAAFVLLSSTRSPTQYTMSASFFMEST